MPCLERQDWIKWLTCSPRLINEKGARFYILACLTVPEPPRITRSRVPSQTQPKAASVPPQ